MSCTAMANDTWPSRLLSVFCGTLNTGPKLAASCTSGKSSAGRVCSVKRLLPPLRMSLFWLDSRLTVWSPGMVRRMSISLRAPTVVVKLPASPSSSAVVRIWIFQIAGGQLQRAAGLADQHVGEDGQGVAALDNACNRLQNRQDFVLCGLQDDHVNL